MSAISIYGMLRKLPSSVADTRGELHVTHRHEASQKGDVYVACEDTRVLRNVVAERFACVLHRRVGRWDCVLRRSVSIDDGRLGEIENRKRVAQMLYSCNVNGDQRVQETV